MRWRLIAKIIGFLTFFLGLAMLVPMAFGIYFGDASAGAFEKAIGVTAPSAFLLYLSNRPVSVDYIRSREGMAIATLGWLAVGFFGALPFYFCEVFGSFVDAFFESISGFTTTGASILTDIESLPEGLLFWRSLIQWTGGMGIIVLSIAVLPFLGVGGMQLYKAEVPSPVPDKLKPRIRDTATVLWKVYVLISAAEIILLMFGGVPLFDAICHTFTTMPTGGFSTKNSSIVYYESPYIESVMIFFMVLAGINFSLHFQTLRGKPLTFWNDSECRFFLGSVLLLTFAVSLDIHRSIYPTIGSAIRYGAFQVVSILTTTGFVTADYAQWPAMTKLILLLCMFLGASAGSTGGGVKCLRVMLCFKYCYRELSTLVHPRAVKHIKLAKKPVPDVVLQSVMGFLAIYVGIYAVAAVMLAGMGVDFVTTLGAVAAAIGNIGPGFGMVGPVANYALIPDMGKWLLILCMLVGRLEIFSVAVFLAPDFWRR